MAMDDVRRLSDESARPWRLLQLPGFEQPAAQRKDPWTRPKVALHSSEPRELLLRKVAKIARPTGRSLGRRQRPV